MHIQRPLPCAGIFLVLLALSSPLHAQEGVHLGIGILPQNTWITNLHDTDTDWDSFTYKFSMGYAAFFKAGYNFVPPLGIHMEVMWSRQGQNHTSRDALDNLHRIDRDLTYLKVPIYLAISSDENQRHKQRVLFCFGGGLYYAKLLTASITDNGTDKFPGENVPDMFRQQHWGGMYYIGSDIRLSEHAPVYFNVRLKGDHSIGTIENRDFRLSNGQALYPANRPKTNNANIGIAAGITFVIAAQGGRGATQLWYQR